MQEQKVMQIFQVYVRYLLRQILCLEDTAKYCAKQNLLESCNSSLRLIFFSTIWEKGEIELGVDVRD